MDTKLEEVAKIIGSVPHSDISLRDVLVGFWMPDYPTPEEIERGEVFARRVLEDIARATVEALREPSVEMEIAGQEAWMCEAAAEDRSGANWRAMIDALLTEGRT